MRNPKMLYVFALLVMITAGPAGLACGQERAPPIGILSVQSSTTVASFPPLHSPPADPTARNAVTAQVSALTWQTEIVDGPDNVGPYSSLALDSANQLHVAYLDVTHGTVEYAHQEGGAWQIETVDTVGSEGGDVSLVLDAADRVHLAYYDDVNGDLKHAYDDGSTWNIETVDSAGIVGNFPAIAVDTLGFPHISYINNTHDDLVYAYLDGTGWHTETVDAAVALNATSLALDAADHPYISYAGAPIPPYTRCMVAYHDGSTWQLETVDDGGGVSEVGLWSSLALNSNGQPCVSYYDAMNTSLRYARREGASWQATTVVSAGDVGSYTSLALDAADHPHICYHDATNSDLLIAYRANLGWYTETVDSAGSVGIEPSIVLDPSSQPHITYYDATNGDLKHAWDIPLEFHRLAAELLEEMRGTDMAPGWDQAQLSSPVRPLYRPDVAGPAYYEFPVFASPGPAGFIIVSTSDHDVPIPHWSFSGNTMTALLEALAAEHGETAARFYKLDTLVYAAENAAGERVALLGEEPLDIVGVDPVWLDDPPPAFELVWAPLRQLDDDSGAAGLTGTLYLSGTLTVPVGLAWQPWNSWADLKAGYSTSYAVLLEWLHRRAAEEWQKLDLIREYGGYMRRGDIRLIPMLWVSPTIALSGPGVGYVDPEVLPRPGLPPILQIEAVDSELGMELSITGTVDYPNGVQETFHLAVIEDYAAYLPLVERPFYWGQQASPPLQQAVEGIGWESWSYYYASADNTFAAADEAQRWYTQIPSGVWPNTSDCYSGCGATAWAMLFGWADYQAASGNPTWEGRWGIYREDGGTGADAVAPDSSDAGVDNMTWEIRNDIDTWCVWPTDNGCTDPSDMGKASNYLEGRSSTRLVAHGRTLFPLDKWRKRAYEVIRDHDAPAIIGIDLLTGAHYPLAYGYKQRRFRICLWGHCLTLYTDYRFYINYGWGSGDKGWVWAIPWFVGWVEPHAPPLENILDDLALHRSSNHHWYYDFGHNGTTNTEGPAWGVQDGDIPLAGDFDRDGLTDDVAIFRPTNDYWYFDYDHDGDADESNGPWGFGVARPLAGDFDRDGFIDDVALFNDTLSWWCYDYDHDNADGICDEVVQDWGEETDRPVAGDWDRDGFVDDVAVFRWMNHYCYYDYDHDGTTDEEHWHWTTENGLPVAGDFDRDGYVDDLALYDPIWEPLPIWWVHLDHGYPDYAVEWGWSDGLPVAGSLGEDQDLP